MYLLFLLVHLKHIRSDPFDIRHLLFQVRLDKNEFVKKKILLLHKFKLLKTTFLENIIFFFIF